MDATSRASIKKNIQLVTDDLKKYIATMEEALSHQHERSTTAYKDLIATLTQQQASDPAEQYARDSYTLFELAPHLLWHSAFATMYAWFEHQMLVWCQFDNIRQKRQTGGSAVGLKTAPKMDDMVSYWKARGIAFPEGGESWKEIIMYRHIRNQIVHNSGFRSPVDAAVQSDPNRPASRSETIDTYVAKRIAKRRGGINCRDVIEIFPEFSREALDTYQSFLGELIEVLP